MLSIITPVLNGSKYIESTILSIMKLSIPYEHIIIDGGSVDSTLDIVNKYPHIKLLKQNDTNGMYSAIHQGFNASNGKYLTWINCDDKVVSSNYDELYKKIVTTTSDLIYSDVVLHYIEKLNYKYFYGLPLPKHFLKKGIMPFAQPSTIFTKEIYKKVGGLQHDKFKIIGDRDLFQRFSFLNNIKIEYLPRPTIIFLMHNESLFYLNHKKVLKEHKLTIFTTKSYIDRVFFYTIKKITKIKRLFL